MILLKKRKKKKDISTASNVYEFSIWYYVFWYFIVIGWYWYRDLNIAIHTDTRAILVVIKIGQISLMKESKLIILSMNVSLMLFYDSLSSIGIGRNVLWVLKHQRMMRFNFLLLNRWLSMKNEMQICTFVSCIRTNVSLVKWSKLLVDSSVYNDVGRQTKLNWNEQIEIGEVRKMRYVNASDFHLTRNNEGREKGRQSLCEFMLNKATRKHRGR